ncbi:MAG: CHAT domain-containing protein [Bacteroidia bacterium]
MPTPKLQFAGFAPEHADDCPMPDNDSPNDCFGPERNTFPPLEKNAEEVNYVSKLLGGNAYSGPEVTETLFHKTSRYASILHFAMHGFLNDCDPLYSGLVFSEDDFSLDDGFLYTYEIYNLDLQADLAVLSACNSGYGELRKGEGIMSLARAFRFAGCANVLMSLWLAEDAATENIMKTFYQCLDIGDGKSDALRKAKLNYLSESAGNHPAFWAGFLMVGDNLPVKKKFPWIHILFAVLIAGFGLGILRKIRARF